MLCIRRWVVRDLEAELTTFELFKTPVDKLIELIALARTRSIGLPELQLPNPPPRSCDTFVFVRGDPEAGAPPCTLFGKNADRPSEESHEVVYYPAQKHDAATMLKCTHIEIRQVAETVAVVLSKPAWMWGCEIGANEYGVAGGNEAIHSQLYHELGSGHRLLGMDLLRLALERSRTAREAVQVCTALLEQHGQGGPCAEDDDWTCADPAPRHRSNGPEHAVPWFRLADYAPGSTRRMAQVREWLSLRRRRRGLRARDGRRPSLGV